MSNTTALSAVTWRRVIAALIAAVLIWVILPAPSAQAATGQRVDLKVLLVADGGPQTAAFATLMDREGIPYTQLTIGAPGRPQITDAFLADSVAGRGYYQAIVLPDQWGTGLAPVEMTAIAKYERSYGVRQVDAYVFPGAPTGQNAVTFSGPLDDAPATVTAQGLSGPFAYLNGSVSIDNFDAGVTEVYGYLATPSGTLPAGEAFTPFVTASASGQSGAIIGVYDHDFREELVITAAYNADQKWFQEVGHGILTWMTRGLHLGHHRNYLNVQVDDVFLPDSRWSSIFDCTPGDTPSCVDDTATDIRMVPADVDRLVTWQNANDFTFDIAFNAQGSDYEISENGSDPLTNAFLAEKAQFTWVNHTYSHTFLGCIQIAPTLLTDNWRCAVPGDTGPYYDEDVAETVETTIGGVRWLSQARIFSEVSLNQQWAVANGLPNFDSRALVTGEHSGLLTQPQQPIDNPLLAPALEAAGILYTASDASRENESRAVDGGTTMTVPRHPMNIFYNAGTYGDEVDEYNWIYTSEEDGGSGICTANPGTSTCIDPLPSASAIQAQSSFLNYIVPIEVRNAYRFVIANDPRPFYAHQSNLAEDGILYPVVEGILDTYRATFNEAASPLVTSDLVSLGDVLNDMATWTSVKNDVTAYVDASGVHIAGPDGTPVPLTVPTGTAVHGATFSTYDAELSGWLSASPSTTLVAEPPVLMGGYIGHTIPDAPTAVAGTIGAFAGSVNLTWTAPENDGNAPITGYEIKFSLAGGSPSWGLIVPAGVVTSTTVEFLDESANYIFQVRAVNAFGPGPWSESSAPVMARPFQHPVAGASVSSPDVPYGADAVVTFTVETTEGHAPSGNATLTINGNSYAHAITGNEVIFSVPSLPQGTYLYTVEYADDLHIEPFSRIGEVTVTQATGAVSGTVVSAPSPQVAGSYQVTVTPASGLPAPTGNVAVTLTNGPATEVLTGTLTGGAVSLVVPSLAAGTWSASIAYTGDAIFAPSVSAGADVVSAKDGPSSALGEVLEEPTPQATGSYRITIAAPIGLAVPTGGVTATLTNEAVAEPVIVNGVLSGGTATLELPALPAGTWDVIVSSTGDANYLGVLLPGESVTSQKAEVSASGEAVLAPTTTATGTYTVTVTPPTGLVAPTGDVTVTFTKGGATEQVTAPLSGGVAALTVPILEPGAWTAAIAYSGDGNYLETNATGEAVVATKSAVESLVGVVANEPTTTTAGTYTVTVTAASGLPIPTGEVEVTLTKGSDTQTVTGTLTDGTVTLDLPSLATGVWEAAVAYSGDAIYEPKEVAGGPVQPGKTAVESVLGEVVKAPTPQQTGTYRVTVTQPTGLGTPTGSVTVTLTDGTTTHSITAALSGGVANLTVPKLPAGTWTAALAYGGDDVLAAVTADGAPVTSVKNAVSKVAGTVNTKPTTTKAGSYTVTVTQPSGLAKATGTVTVTLTKGTLTRTVNGTLVSGTVKITIPKLAAGTWKSSITYQGNANYLSRTSTGPSVVSAKTAVTKINSVVSKTPTTKVAGAYKVVVYGPTGQPKPTGKVSIVLKKGSTTKKISGTLSAGAVKFKVPKLAKGTWRVTVYYGGSSTYLGKTVAGKAIVVRR